MNYTATPPPAFSLKSLIQHNPYRVVGVFANATSKELQKQKTKIKAYAKVGKSIKSDVDFQILGAIERSEQSLNKSFSFIDQNQDKLDYALFWFVNKSSFDKIAFNYLRNGDEEKALEILEKTVVDKAVSTKNFTAFNNIGSLKLLSNHKHDIKIGIEYKIKLIESDFFEHFVRCVADETLQIDKKRQTEYFIDALLKTFKNLPSNNDIFQLFSDCSATTKAYVSKKLTEEPLQKIESQIENCKRKRKADKENTYEFGLTLFTKTKDNLATLKSLLKEKDLKYQNIADRLAQEIMQCGIDYFNELQKNKSSDNYLEQSQQLTELAKSIAVGKLTKDRAKDSLATLEKMKDQAINEAILILQSIKDAYEKAIKLIILESYLYLFDWDKVNDLLRKVLPIKSLIKIKASSNNQLKSEFTELAYWLKEHSPSSSYISRIINNYKKIKPTLTFKILSSEITNTDNKPLFTKFIRYIGLKLDIQVIEDSEITFHLKYIDPKGRVDRNSKSSPKGYTLLDTKTLNINSTSINFSGRGNAEKCTYVIGEHRIEVYVEEYLVHTKKYSVDLAPSEKIGKELSEAESRLRKINQTNYFENEIRNARSEMSEIQKFKLFRGISEKQRQIESQQTKIDQIVKKSKNKKRKNIKLQEEKIYKLKMELSAAKY